MNIFHKVTLQSMKKSRTRTIVTIIGVMLSAAMITAIASFAVSLQSYLVDSSSVKYGSWHVAFLDVDSSFVQERSHDKEIANTASFANIGYAALTSGQNPNKPYLFIAGFNEQTFHQLPLQLLSGRLPENSGEILVPAHVEANGGVKLAVGDTLSLTVGDRMQADKRLGQHDPYYIDDFSGMPAETLVPKAEKAYTVVGTYQRPSFEEYAAPGYTLITTTDPTDQADNFSVFVTLINPRGVHKYTSNTAGNHAYLLNDNVLRFMGLSSDTLFNTLLYSVGSILVLLIMIGSIFLIYNSFNISLNERTRQFGILASVGATAKQLRNSVLFEGLCIGAIGIPLGIIVGLGSISLVISLVAGNFRNLLSTDVPLRLVVSAPALIAAAVVSMVTILISAYLPAQKAVHRPVMECIRQTNEIKVEAKAIKTSKHTERFYSLEAILALKNFKRNKKRYRSIVLSLTLSVVLFVSASAFNTNLNTIAEMSKVEIDGDILFYTQDMEENQLLQLYQNLQTVDGVSHSTYQALSTYTCTTDDFPSEFLAAYRQSTGDARTEQTLEFPLDIQFIEDNIYQDFIKSIGLSTTEYMGQDAKMIIVGVDASAHTTLFTNNTMDFTIHDASGEQAKILHATFVNSYPLDPPPKALYETTYHYEFMVVAPYQMKPQFDTLETSTRLGLVFWSESPGQSAKQMQTIISDAGITAGYTLYNVHAILEENRNITFIINLFTIIFTMMISLIAVANVFNTISTNIKLRRRELAMLRSVGMSDRDFNKMMRFECALYGLRTLLFGLPIAALLSWLIYKAMVVGGAEIDFIFPWASFTISILGVFLVVFITMLYAVSKIKKENIIDALRDDMT